MPPKMLSSTALSDSLNNLEQHRSCSLWFSMCLRCHPSRSVAPLSRRPFSSVRVIYELDVSGILSFGADGRRAVERRWYLWQNLLVSQTAHGCVPLSQATSSSAAYRYRGSSPHSPVLCRGNVSDFGVCGLTALCLHYGWGTPTPH